MGKCLFLILGSLFLSIPSSNAVPLESLSKSIVDVSLEKDAKLEAQSYNLAEVVGDAREDKPGQREKRFYNYFDYNNDFNVYPDFPIPFRQNIQRREPLNSFGNYGSQDQLDLILTKLKEIQNDRTYLPPRPIPVPYPTYIPIIYVPNVACDCSSKDFKKEPRPETNKTVLEFPDRFSNTDDQPVVGPNLDDSENDYSDEEGLRPISFTPIKLDKPLSKPPPPFEHGSVQAGAEPPMHVSTTNPLTQDRETADALADALPDASLDISPPTICEKASIFCCHQPTVNRSCFISHGCMDMAYFRNGCVPKLLLSAIDRLLAIYKQKLPSGS